ncbi:spore cortex-lytic enzyme [Paenibacillus antri]|uniref:Spore cortex-lytic enzyme n=1 Tax=Paenibacillus antri TaxID=2582848 RepID=A0A5R9GDT2_9BACL|nr:spore cortex-lytic enzyme [Paenibacillus antri]TLS52260.1 spore cortex-lytic enzyme [Paenibacillus antri]
MRTRLLLVTLCLVVGLAFAFQAKQRTADHSAEEAFSKTTLKYGAVGQDVRELQGRLKFLGYYNGAIDGDFGYSTLKSVKNFQWKFGMKADGIVGDSTKLKLYNATKNWRPGADTGGGATASKPKAESAGAAKQIQQSSHRGFSSNDLKMMANAVYGEARGEPYEGQVAVAAVILNRVDSASFPNTPSGVIFQPGAFTAVADGQIWLTPNESAMKAVQDALNGWDPSDGCLYYFNPVTATSKWIWTRPQYKQIGKHIFCR